MTHLLVGIVIIDYTPGSLIPHSSCTNYTSWLVHYLQIAAVLHSNDLWQSYSELSLGTILGHPSSSVGSQISLMSEVNLSSVKGPQISPWEKEIYIP